VEIVNLHPAKGEADKYVLGPSNTSLAEDYAVVALVKGINPEHWELILAGTTTIGTQAAVEYVTAGKYLDELLKRMNVTAAQRTEPVRSGDPREGGAGSAGGVVAGGAAGVELEFRAHRLLRLLRRCDEFGIQRCSFLKFRSGFFFFSLPGVAQ